MSETNFSDSISMYGIGIQRVFFNSLEDDLTIHGAPSGEFDTLRTIVRNLYEFPRMASGFYAFQNRKGQQNLCHLDIKLREVSEISN